MSVDKIKFRTSDEAKLRVTSTTAHRYTAAITNPALAKLLPSNVKQHLNLFQGRIDYNRL